LTPRIPKVWHRDGRITVCRTTWDIPAALIHAKENADECQAWCLKAGWDWISTVRVGRHFIRHAFASAELLEETIECLLRAGLKPGVSSWGAVWRRLGGFIPPCHEADVRTKLLEGCWPYPYMQTVCGEFGGGAWEEWDIKSAYPWASSIGLPAPWTMRIVPYEESTSDRQAYLLKGWRQSSHYPERLVPPAWAKERDETNFYVDPLTNRLEYRDDQRMMFDEDPPGSTFWIPGESVHRFGLTWNKSDELCRVEWDHEVDLRGTFERLYETFPNPIIRKMVLAAHWGAWSKGAGCMMGMFSHGRPLAKGDGSERIYELASTSNPLFAGLLHARVSTRVAEYADGSPRVFVDSLLLPEGYAPHPNGNAIGDWRLKRTFAYGVRIPDHPRRPIPLTHPSPRANVPA
jgi:hypothetical protein